MNEKIAKQWAEALRSGDYKQNIGSLRNGDTFCCLGVLCNLHAQQNPDLAANQTDSGHYFGHDGCLPRIVARWADMKSMSGELYDGSTNSLAQMNDFGKSFKEIADKIAWNWEKL